MARETIASVKRELRDETKRLRGIISGEAAAHKVQLQLAHDANARLIADKVDLIRSHTQALNLKDERIVELIRGHAGVIASKDARISELFRSNNEYQAEARSARGEVARLQRALSDASRVIATLGQRSEA